MRVAIGIVIATLTLGLGYGPALAQTQPSEVPALESIHMVDALTGWAVTNEQEAERFLRTTDGGIHWRDVTPLTSSGQKIRIGKVAVLTSLIAWVLSGELFRTVDGGRTWSNRYIPGGWVQSMHFINPRDGIVSVQGANMASAEQVIYGSTDGGQTWIKVASTRPFEATGSGLQLQSGLYFDFAFLNAAIGWVTGISIAGDFVYLYVSHDGGRTWRLQKLPLPLLVTSPWEGITRPPKFFTARHGILPAFYDNLNSQSYRSIASFAIFYVTDDGGMTWTSTTPVSTAHSGVAPYSFADANHGWLADGDRISRAVVLYATSDGGHHWTTIRPAPPFASVEQLDFISPQIGWAVSRTSPFLLKTLDGGHTWAPVTYTISRQ